MLSENCYVVSDETKECVIIDCGAFSPEERKEIVDYIRTESLKPVHLLATHGHFDHHLGIDTIYNEFGLKVEIHRSDEQLIRTIREQAESMCMMNLDGHHYESPDTWLSNGGKVKFGNHELQCIAAPGHTMGGLLFYDKDEKVMFSGDTLFRQSIGRTDLPGGSMFMIINSLRYICQLPDDIVVYPGHGPQTTIGYELTHNPYLDR